METLSHLIETRNFVDKCLVCDIQVKDVFYYVVGTNIRTNKWLHFENWLELDAAIDSLLNPYRESKSLDGFETRVIYLDGSIRVDCKRIRMSRAYKQILGKDKEYAPDALSILVTRMDTKALIEQITRIELQTKQEVQIVNSTPRRKHDSKEYDPTINNNNLEQVSLQYVPYTASVKQNGVSTKALAESDIHENEPYSPKPIVESSPDQISDSPNEVPTYRPARIAVGKEGNTHSSNESQTDLDEKLLNSPKPLRQRRLPIPEVGLEDTNVPKDDPKSRPRPTNAELFGSDDSDQESGAFNYEAPLQAASPKRVATPIRTPNTSGQLHQKIKRKRSKLRYESGTKNPLDGWLSKRTNHQVEKVKEKSSKKSLRYPVTEERRTESSKKESRDRSKSRNLDELQQIKELTALKETIKSKRKSPPVAMEILSLTHLSLEDILGTFESFKPTLDDIFKTYSKKTKVTGFDGINHMKTLTLIDDKKQLQMMNFLRENYQPHEKGVPSLTDLYINALVPEWTVNVFMREFNFTRPEAIKRLQDQENSSVHHVKEGFDSSTPL